MSDPVMMLAESLTAANDNTPAGKLAERLLEESHAHAKLAEAYSDLYRKFNAKQHEVERMRDGVERAGVASDALRAPELQVYCNEDGCSTPPLRALVAPPESAVPQWVAGMGWQWLGEGVQFCPQHRKSHPRHVRLLRQYGSRKKGEVCRVVGVVPHGGHTDSECQYVLADGGYVVSDAVEVLP